MRSGWVSPAWGWRLFTHASRWKGKCRVPIREGDSFSSLPLEAACPPIGIDRPAHVVDRSNAHGTIDATSAPHGLLARRRRPPAPRFNHPQHPSFLLRGRPSSNRFVRDHVLTSGKRDGEAGAQEAGLHPVIVPVDWGKAAVSHEWTVALSGPQGIYLELKQANGPPPSFAFIIDRRKKSRASLIGYIVRTQARTVFLDLGVGPTPKRGPPTKAKRNANDRFDPGSGRLERWDACEVDFFVTFLIHVK